MEEIKVGEYVRTDRGVIYEYTKEEKNDIMMQDFRLCNDGKIVKHSPNIIDLIEEGDYVNESKVIDIVQVSIKAVYTENQEQKLALIPIINEQIKSVVTKEMFNQVKYEV